MTFKFANINLKVKVVTSSRPEGTSFFFSFTRGATGMALLPFGSKTGFLFRETPSVSQAPSPFF